MTEYCRRVRDYIQGGVLRNDGIYCRTAGVETENTRSTSASPARVMKGLSWRCSRSGFRNLRIGIDMRAIELRTTMGFPQPARKHE
jgi:hypothetical protein